MSTISERLFNLSSELLGAVDGEGFVVESNPAWKELLGWDREELKGMTSVDLVHPDDLEATMAATARGLGSDIVRYECRVRTKDGGYRWVAWRAVHPTTASDPIAIAGRDITAEKEGAESQRIDEEIERRMRQEALSAATSTPIIQVWDDIVTMPVVGLVDSVRAADMKTALLEVVSRTGAKFAIVDLTGVDTVDTATADHLLKVMRAVQLLGARCVITGIQPAVAQIIVGLGLDMQGVVTLRSLREGLRFCLRRLGFKVQREVKAEPLLLPESGKDASAAS
jgi:PAS domain S-box-containing protein